MGIGSKSLGFCCQFVLSMRSPSAMDDMLSTPSPPGSGTAGTSSSTSNSISRRPPRKSTLTQQQKNQKRQRATQDQLVTLEVEFSKNPTPTAVVRERIAQDINMTERSVQIWFQNRCVAHLRETESYDPLIRELAGVPSSSYSRRRVSSLVKIAMPYPRQCVNILLLRP